MKEIKDRMFQYAYGAYAKIIVKDTGLITKTEAYKLWDKYYSDVVEQLKEKDRPQMVIWKDCKTPIDYHTEEKEIDWRDDIVVENNKVYKITKEKIT